MGAPKKHCCKKCRKVDFDTAIAVRTKTYSVCLLSLARDAVPSRSLDILNLKLGLSCYCILMHDVNGCGVEGILRWCNMGLRDYIPREGN